MKFEFGQFFLDGGRRQLRRRDEIVAFAPRPFALLELLLERWLEAVSKDEILERIRSGTVSRLIGFRVACRSGPTSLPSSCWDPDRS